MDWLRVQRGDAPLVIAFPHGGTDLAGLDEQFVSPWHAQIDTDWWIAELYAFAADLGATLVATDISRSVIDMNRDPSGASLDLSGAWKSIPWHAASSSIPITALALSAMSSRRRAPCAAIDTWSS